MPKPIETMSSAFEKQFSERAHELPGDHSPKFAPVLDPKLRMDLEALPCTGGASLDQHETTQ
ncbi:hypothetical protein BJG93_22690 [Paraburkholderia sprentiae WSM5005]|uniref:Uncharacterized protein n=1 Tax=Paraburkholderia sprentiae WSM5005 TaxID=754502 RepID=A0A1I9YPG1_9BURK|nr:hypothetical protein [Paraburkholderia sprentiae]APA88194.1 hypothetical protein BJG93_22690 [Paraburkholderia sprentiae WSM5005]